MRYGDLFPYLVMYCTSTSLMVGEETLWSSLNLKEIEQHKKIFFLIFMIMSYENFIQGQSIKTII